MQVVLQDFQVFQDLVYRVTQDQAFLATLVLACQATQGFRVYRGFRVFQVFPACQDIQVTILDQVDFQESAGFQASQDLVFRVTQGQASRAIRDLVYRDTQDYRAFLESAGFRETVGLVEYPD